jgi:hypothetical protein
MQSWGGDKEFYSMFDFAPRHVPETIIQYTPEHSIKVDQLPGGVTHEEVKSDLQDAGYERVGTVGSYEILVNREESKARAVGEGYHILSITHLSFGEDLERKRMDIEMVLDAYQSEETELQTDMQDMKAKIDIKDTFSSKWTGHVERGHVETEEIYFLDISDPKLQPNGGAITFDIEQKQKTSVWKFDNEGRASTTYEIYTSDGAEMAYGYDTIEQDGEYLIAEGSIDKDNDRGAYFSPDPTI